MDGSYPSRNINQGSACGIVDLEASNQMHQEQHSKFSFVLPPQQQPQPQLYQSHPPMHDMFPLSSSYMQDQSERRGISVGEKGRSSTSDDDEASRGEDCIDCPDGKGKKASQWHRVKWTGDMVKLLVTAAAYVDEDVSSDYGTFGKQKFAMLKRKGKWKLISRVMEERGFRVSPQQCEDKFNDLNKRYKRLTDILGRGTSCKVVESPSLLDGMNLSEKVKDEVRKMLSSKHLYYEEMCSYHNHNKLSLLDDPILQRSLRQALRSRDGQEQKRSPRIHLDEDEQYGETDDEDDDHDDNDHDHSHVNSSLDHGTTHGSAGEALPHKRPKLGTDHEELQLANSSHSPCCTRHRALPQGIAVDINQAFPEGSSGSSMQKRALNIQSLQIEEQRVQIQAQMLDLESQRFKWERFSKKKERELEKMKMENEKMRLENERLALELRHKEIELELKSKRN